MEVGDENEATEAGVDEVMERVVLDHPEREGSMGHVLLGERFSRELNQLLEAVTRSSPRTCRGQRTTPPEEAMSTGYFISRAGKRTAVHYVLHGTPICGVRVRLDAYHYSATGFDRIFVDCARCRRILKRVVPEAR
jgi:hypothetical protein